MSEKLKIELLPQQIGSSGELLSAKIHVVLAEENDSVFGTITRQGGRWKIFDFSESVVHHGDLYYDILRQTVQMAEGSEWRCSS